MFTRVNGVWSWAGATLALVALYLVLTNSNGFEKVVTSSGAAYGGILKTLQGR